VEGDSGESIAVDAGDLGGVDCMHKEIGLDTIECVVEAFEGDNSTKLSEYSLFSEGKGPGGEE
jgi:hypothetical protein